MWATQSIWLIFRKRPMDPWKTIPVSVRKQKPQTNCTEEPTSRAAVEWSSVMKHWLRAVSLSFPSPSPNHNQFVFAPPPEEGTCCNRCQGFACYLIRQPANRYFAWLAHSLYSAAWFDLTRMYNSSPLHWTLVAVYAFYRVAHQTYPKYILSIYRTRILCSMAGFPHPFSS